MAVRWWEGVVVENRVMGNKFRLLSMKVVGESDLEFVPGQFLLMRMGSANKINDYSICSIPQDGVIETLIDITPADFDPPAGEGSRYIRGLVPGDRVEFAGPAGNFVYRDDGAERVWFVVTGSGISSVWSIMRSLLYKNGERREVRLWWGLRFVRDVIWMEELGEMSGQFSNFGFEYVISQPEGEWGGKVGHVTDRVREELVKIGGGDGVAVYICGNKNMVEEMKVVCGEGGVAGERVYWEKYF